MKFRGLLRRLNALRVLSPVAPSHRRSALWQQPALWQGLESLENRVLLSTTLDFPTGGGTTTTTTTPAVTTSVGYALTPPPQDANGWTIIPPLQTGRDIYVSSSSGNDANDGLTPGTPKQTIAAGFSLLRSGVGDHLLLKAGDTWNTGIPHWVGNAGGASRTDPMVISSYGTGAAPLLETNFISSGGGAAIDLTGGGGAPTAYAHIWVIGLDFYDAVRDPSSASYNPTVSPTLQDGAVGILTTTTDFLIENCTMRFYANNIAIEAPGSSDIRIRRNQILDSWIDSSAHSQGVLIGNVSNLLIEGNLIDHNGWNATVPAGESTIFNHNVYTRDCTNVTFDDNITADASSYGFTATGDPGIYTSLLVTNNLFLGDGNDMVLGGVNADTVIQNNVFIATGAAGTVAQGLGVTVDSGTDVQVVGNMFLNTAAGSLPDPWLCLAALPQTSVVATGNTVAGWSGENGTGNGISNFGVAELGVNLSSNATSGGAWSLDVNSYDAALGGPGTWADFLSRAANENAANWNVAYTAAAVGQYLAGGAATGGTTTGTGGNGGSSASTVLAIAKQPTSVTAGAALSPKLTVNVENASGGIVTNDSSTVTLSIASGPAGATIGGTVSATAVNGVATFSTLSLPIAGNYTLRVIDGALGGATSLTMAVLPSTPARLQIVQQPAGAAVGTNIATPTVVDIEDAYGNVATSSNSSVTLSVASGPAGGTLSGTTTVNAVNGVATFSNLSLLTAGGYTLKAIDNSASTVTPATSTAFSVSAGTATRLVVTQQPGGVTAGAPFIAPLSVAIEDAAGNIITSPGTAVSVAIATGPAGAMLIGSTSVTAQNGVATFSNLSLPTAGAYTLAVTAPGLSGTATSTFSVAPGNTTQIFITQQPGTAVVGRPLAQPLSIAMADSSGNLSITDRSGLQLVIASGPTGGMIGGVSTVTAVNGMATFNGVTFNVAGTYTLNVIDTSVPGINPARSASFIVEPAPVQRRWGFGGQGGSVSPPVATPGVTPTPDVTPPTAQLSAPADTIAPTPGSSTLSFNVTFTDASGINIAKIGTGDITVVGPHGVKQVAKLTAIDGLQNNSSPTATYSIIPTGGIWSSVDNGTYTIQLNSGQVFDATGNAASAQTLGSFVAKLPTVIDNVTAGHVAKTGTWLTETTTAPAPGSPGVQGSYTGANYFQAVSPTATFTYTPALVAGSYGVYLNSPGGTGLATNVQVEIITADGGTTKLTWDQQIGGMTYLGTFELGSKSRVVIQAADANGSVVADAAMFA